MNCPKCNHYNIKQALECQQCGIVFEKYIDARERKRLYHDKIEREYHELSKKSQLIIEERWKLLFPIFAFVFIPVAKFFIFPAMVFDSMHMWAHEFGHASAAWFGGRAATPFILWTSISLERSWLVFVCFLFLTLFILYKTYREKTYFVMVCCCLAIFLQLYLTLWISEDQLDLVFTHSGVGGEFYISTFAIMAFHYRFPKGSYWPFLRYWLLLAGVYVFFKSFYFWQQVDEGVKSIPWGSAIHGHDDQNGDMNKLRYVWGWSPKRIVNNYVGISYMCLSVMTIHYITVVLVQITSKKYLIIERYNKIFNKI
ncbi:hypothetical protein MRY82_08030 [bacterium]|nr:hypothetical protein [bacterium]